MRLLTAAADLASDLVVGGSPPQLEYDPQQGTHLGDEFLWH